MCRIWIGTSGWGILTGGGRFYPTSCPLTTIWRTQPTASSPPNSSRSLYRVPAFKHFRGWAEQVVPSQRSALRESASRSITHLEKLRDPEATHILLVFFALLW